jgi:hypothetical protein
MCQRCTARHNQDEAGKYRFACQARNQGEAIMKQAYQSINIRKAGLDLIEHVNRVIDDYQDAGYTLTLRQIYYQLVAGAIIENTETSYKNIGNLINNGRLAGLIDWEAIEDRTRVIRKQSAWDSPAQILQDAARAYQRNLWETQDNYIEIWVEKDALIAVVEQAANQFNCPCFSCRGYSSQTAIHDAAMRFIEKAEQGKDCILIYLGDHDPSGLDMTRDIRERLIGFDARVDVRRIALNQDQVDLYKPPVNPAKITDSRAKEYIAKHGIHSWELDALSPEVIGGLIANAIEINLDQKRFNRAKEQQESERQALQAAILSINTQ